MELGVALPGPPVVVLCIARRWTFIKGSHFRAHHNFHRHIASHTTMSISSISHIALILALVRHTAAAPVADAPALEERQFSSGSDWGPKNTGPPSAVIVPVIIIAVVIGVGIIGTLIWKFVSPPSASLPYPVLTTSGHAA